MKILISWQAFNHDYVISNSGSKMRFPSENGPTFAFHRDFWEGSGYDKHIILNSSTEVNDVKNFTGMISHLKENFKGRVIEGRLIQLDDVINVPEIISKLTPLLTELIDQEVEAFISPGTPAMQTAWYLLGTTFRSNFKIFQTRAGKYTTDGKQERIYIDLDSDVFPANVTAAQRVLDDGKPVTGNGIKITESLKPIYTKAAKIAQTDKVGALILGENGTGKENLAKYIHDNSTRSNKLFLAINCAAYSDELLRSELFGYEKGAFTGANEKKKGLLEVANGGTVLLDEIGDISPKMQVSLLRVLQENKIQPVGATKEIDINVRVIAATNRNLEEFCEAEKFRWDLFYRLAVTTLHLPALRNRGGDEIGEMIHHFNEIVAQKFPEKKILKISSEVMKKLRTYGYKGNIRELQNLFIQFYTFCEGEIRIDDLPARFIENKGDPRSLAEVEKNQILKVYGDGKSPLVEMASILGCTRDTLRKKLKEYGVYE
ncbi:sigma 54-interacting transcriptional regulator [Algoriphagus sp.]|uniref:sigma 54-interacting transcriptional regulator n=1 Tax=Algoriphagus sp. TaxID=1872435 RepID=UPI003F71355A